MTIYLSLIFSNRYYTTDEDPCIQFLSCFTQITFVYRYDDIYRKKTKKIDKLKMSINT